MARREKKAGTVRTIAKADRVALCAKRLSDSRDSLYLMIYEPTGTGKKYRYEFLRLYLSGERKADEENKALAIARMRAADERERDAQNRTPNGFNPNNSKADFFAYFDHLTTMKDKQGHSWKSTGIHLRAFSKRDAVAFDEINPQWLAGFREYLLKTVKRSTAFLYFGLLNTAMRRAVRDDILLSNPFDKTDSIRNEHSRRMFLTPDEVKALKATPCRRDDVRRAFLFACFTGLRVSDIRNLQWERVRADHLDVVQQKTRKQIQVPLTDPARSFMPERGKRTDFVFPLPSEVTVGEVLVDWTRAAGIDKHITFHCARHTCATLLLNSGAGIKTVAEFIGDNLRNAEVYAKLLDETKRQAADRMAALFSDLKAA